MSPRRIALFLDGTWNRPDNQTNVYILYQETQGIDARACLRQLDRARRGKQWFDATLGRLPRNRLLDALEHWIVADPQK